MYLLVLFIPLITSLFYLLFGKFFGIKGVQLIIKLKILILLILSLLIIFEVYFNNSIIQIFLLEWIIDGAFISFKFDYFSSIILFLIILIFSVVILYSLWYMHDDPFIIRFLGFLSIFTFMMIFLVISNNSLTMFIGWEGVGLTSYLLINFWWTIIQANKAAIKAIIYNKIGDILFMLGLIMSNIYNNNSNFNSFYIYFLDSNLVFWISFFFIIAAMAKSAQFFFDSWLGDAMMGPTPVSALLHAATMVTAGVYLLIRLLPSFILPISIINFGSIIGLFTIILGGFVALFQNDIKKIIAYSTCSQLGYMFYGLFIGIDYNSYYHLFIHGFFKALLFLSGGIIIHNILLNQDSRKSPSLIFFMPLSYIFFTIGTLSIISWPFYSGFFSKDPIILFSSFNPFFHYLLTNIGALLTISYSFKLLFNSFFGRPSFYSSKFNFLEPSFPSFLFLIFGSLFIGYFAFPSFFTPISNSNFNFSSHYFDLEFLPFFMKFLPLIIIPFGILIGTFFNSFWYLNIYMSIFILFPFYSIFNRRFFFEYIYNYFISIIFFNKIFKFIDNGLLDFNTFFKRTLFTSKFYLL